MVLLNKRFFISLELGDCEVIFPALICRNTRTKEKPFRLTWFKFSGGDSWQGINGRETSPIFLKPLGHIDFKTSNLELIRRKLEKVSNSHRFMPNTNFRVKINLAFSDN